MKQKILVTAIGTVTAATIVMELKKTDEYYIIGADINPEYAIASSLETDEFYVFPPVADEESYLEFVLKFCEDHHVKYYFAVLDKEVVNIARNRQRFEELGILLCVVNYEFAKICHYKNDFWEWIKENIPEIAIKTFASYSEILEVDFPLFIKPTEGVSSQGCRRIDTLEELQISVLPEQVNAEILIQELAEGDVITVDLIRNAYTGQSAQIQRKELLRNANGCGIAVEIVEDTILSDICDLLMEKLNLNGIANAEFFYYDGKYKIIEINPRFSAGGRYSCMAGVNIVMNAIRIADQKECSFGQIMVGKHFAERYEAFLMD